MPAGIQEIIALVIVFAVVALAFRRRRKAHRDDCGGCDDCGTDAKASEKKTETELRFYRRNR